jgi:hypothetical protein
MTTRRGACPVCNRGIQPGVKVQQRRQGEVAGLQLQEPAPAGHQPSSGIEILAGEPAGKRLGCPKRCRVVEIDSPCDEHRRRWRRRRS